MERYISVDAGKFGTKVAEYLKEKDTVRVFQFRTKIGAGDFRDDAIENDTFIIGVKDKVFKVGNGARGDGAELETSKQSIVHKNCTMAAVAKLVSDNEVDTVNLAVGLPAKEWAVVSKREDYKDFMFPSSTIEVKIKESSTSPVKTKKFKINKEKSCVFPESIGALFMDDSPKVTPTSYIGVLDLGNLNLNATLWHGIELQQDESITSELGGSILIQEVSQELSAEFSRCDEKYVAQMLKKVPEKRHLTPRVKNPNDKDEAKYNQKIIDDSRELIHKIELDHAKKVKRCCDGRNWSIDYMDIVAIGGTSSIIKDELKEVFGNITILKNSEMCNALGFLRMLCSRMPEINKVIPLTDIKNF